MKNSLLAKFWFRIIIFLFLGFVLSFIFDVIFSIIYRNQALFQSFRAYVISACATWVVIEGIYHINKKLSTKVSWEDTIVKRFAIQILINTFFGASTIILIRIVFGYLFVENVFFRLLDEMIYLVAGFIIVIIVTFIDFGVFLFEKWKASVVEMEKYNKDRAEFQFEMLQSQINPHFLFNSLNTLSSLIYENKDQASEFTRELSDVYRYVLESRKSDLVKLKDELEFLESFLYLYRLRFEKKLTVHIEIDEKLYQQLIPPLTLQMLIENAVKHNIVSQKKPLKISLKSEENYIIVKNNIQLKLTETYSSKVGLSNIQNRFKYLTNSEVKITNNKHVFEVQIPLIVKHESINN
jgi:two-component system, LytTR family, sensor kinase